jgi:TPR repeat protein
MRKPRHSNLKAGVVGLLLLATMLLQQSANAEERYRGDSLARLLERAEQGNAQACYEAGARFYLGHGASQDFGEAAKWWRLAALQEHPRAQTALGMLYRDGRGTPQNDVEAVKWFKKAAQQRDSSAQYILGSFYHVGRGVTRDDKEAFRLWDAAAASGGLPAAQFALAGAYLKGIGTPVDAGEGFKWMTEAAERNHLAAQAGLAFLYSNGLGATKDYVQAYKWISIAHLQLARRKDGSSVRPDQINKMREQIAGEMSASDVAKAQSLAERWKPRDRQFQGLDPFPPQ